MTPAALTFPERKGQGETMTISLTDAFPDLTEGRKTAQPGNPLSNQSKLDLCQKWELTLV
jgi:hypothetical protein